MNIPETVGFKTTLFVKKYNPKIGEVKLDEIQYISTTLFSMFYKTLILFITAYFLNILPIYLLLFFLIGLIRTSAGGIHTESETTCLIVSTLLTFPPIYIGQLIKPNIFILHIVYLVSLCLLSLYAPGDTKNKPITNAILHKKLKLSSMAIITVYYIMALLTTDSLIFNLLIYSIAIGAIMTTPFVYKISQCQRSDE